MQRYTKSVVLGQGTYGKVVKAVDNETGCITAIKKIRVAKEKEGVHVTALREIKVLKELKHEHVLELLDIFHHKRNLNLVFEYMHSDLEAVIKDERMPLKPGDVKAYMLMTVKAVAYCHGMWVLHRDLKPNNLLIAPDGSLKLADFGLARVFGSPDRRLTNQVFQRWYRAPELLFGARQYGSAVDMWALGCIFAELLLRRPYFAGNTDLDQLSKVFSALGTPTEADWPGHRTLPDFVEFAFTAAPDKRRTFPNATDDALSLLSRLLTFDPNKRITAEEALQHRYFKTSPAPTASDKLPRPKPFAPEEDEPIPPPLEEPRLRASPETRCSLAERVSFPLGTSEGSKGGGQALRVSLSRPFQVSLPDEPTSGGPASARSMPMSVVRGHVRNSSCGSDALMMSGGSDRPLPTSIESGEGGRSPLPFGGIDRRYIRKRKMELDEALLSASQDDPNLSPPEEEGR